MNKVEIGLSYPASQLYLRLCGPAVPLKVKVSDTMQRADGKLVQNPKNLPIRIDMKI